MALASEKRAFSNLYKVLWGQLCPNCKCFISHGGGCKFMECALCKYAFCWYCMDEFYTQFHYDQSLCPLRLYVLYSGAVLLLVTAAARIYVLSILVKGVVDTTLGYILTLVLWAKDCCLGWLLKKQVSLMRFKYSEWCLYSDRVKVNHNRQF